MGNVEKVAQRRSHFDEMMSGSVSAGHVLLSTRETCFIERQSVLHVLFFQFVHFCASRRRSLYLRCVFGDEAKIIVDAYNFFSFRTRTMVPRRILTDQEQKTLMV